MTQNTNLNVVDLPMTDVPRTLSIRDLIVIISVAITLAVQWGIFSTRVSILEKSNEALVITVEKQQTEIRQLQVRVQDHSQFINEMYRSQNKTMPPYTMPY